MEYTTLGTSDIEVSRVGLGLWNIVDDVNWTGVDEERAIETIHAAYDAGITFFDTAEAYGDGYSEEVLGSALESMDREEVVVATKAWPENLAYDDLIEACHASRDRLGVDTIDVYYLHYANPGVPIEGTARALRDLKAEGAIEVPAVANFGPLDLEAILEEVRVDANQVPYSLLWRAIEHEVAPACRARDVDVVAYSPLAQGLLTGRFDAPDDVPEGRARTRLFSGDRPKARHDEDGAEDEAFAAIERIESICAEEGLGMVETAIAWTLGRPGVASTLVGATNPEQARANAAAVEVDLPEAMIEELDRATEPLREALGENPDPWQSDSRYR